MGRLLKTLIAVCLLPVAWIWTQSFFSVFSHATRYQQFWATEEFWFFALGGVLWLIAFFGLPRPVMVYVLGHELTHAFWVWVMGGRVTSISFGVDGGHVETNRNNFWISLAPYFFPIYSALVIILFGVTSIFYDLFRYHWMLWIFFGLIGLTWSFHFTFTCWMIPKGQTDFAEHGTFFSLVLIYLMNLLVLSFFLVVAAPGISVSSFALELQQNGMLFWDWILSFPV